MLAQELNSAGSFRCLSSGTSGLLALVLLCAALLAPGVSVGQTEIEGEVSGVWDVDGSPYILVGNASVPEDENLTVEAGVEVVFGEGITSPLADRFAPLERKRTLSGFTSQDVCCPGG